MPPLEEEGVEGSATSLTVNVTLFEELKFVPSSAKKKISLMPLKFAVGVKVAMPVLLLMDTSIFETGVKL